MIEEVYEDGVLVDTRVTEDPVTEVDPTTELQIKLAALGATLLSDPEYFNELVASVANSNTAKGPLNYVNLAVQVAAQAEP